MNIREGARRVRVIGMWLIGLGIVAAVIDAVVMEMNHQSFAVVNWAFLMVPGFVLALAAWVLDGFAAPEEDKLQQRTQGN